MLRDGCEVIIVRVIIVRVIDSRYPIAISIGLRCAPRVNPSDGRCAPNWKIGYCYKSST